MDKKLILVTITMFFMVAFLLAMVYKDKIVLTGNVIKNESNSTIIYEDVEAKLGQIFTLREGQAASINSSGLHIHFIDLVEDSRCPTNATCIQAGQAVAEIEFAKSGGKSATIKLSDGSSNNIASSAELFLYKIRVYDISPHPESNVSIPKSDYNITLMVTH